MQHALLEGVGDVVAYGVVVTPEREELVLFTTPIDSNVKQVIVTGPKAPPIANLEREGGVRQPSDGGWRPELGRRGWLRRKAKVVLKGLLGHNFDSIRNLALRGPAFGLSQPSPTGCQTRGGCRKHACGQER